MCLNRLKLLLSLVKVFFILSCGLLLILIWALTWLSSSCWSSSPRIIRGLLLLLHWSLILSSITWRELNFILKGDLFPLRLRWKIYLHLLSLTIGLRWKNNILLLWHLLLPRRESYSILIVLWSRAPTEDIFRRVSILILLLSLWWRAAYGLFIPLQQRPYVVTLILLSLNLITFSVIWCTWLGIRFELIHIRRWTLSQIPRISLVHRRWDVRHRGFSAKSWIAVSVIPSISNTHRWHLEYRRLAHAWSLTHLPVEHTLLLDELVGLLKLESKLLNLLLHKFSLWVSQELFVLSITCLVL